ncbi:hypothetical protein G3N59_32750 [Paraburkholderia sp. Ac-20340]|uniref:hypothetical protein n=1 Tax=Paraburkholderia sp. Ac-20340 TaxID=2703888 RepID=UPI00197DAD74|nr:hypothetical protein [Paraburkholderia sp. Ac-20340]MBN3858167.1 hypothetical protein [Paraburkholderia sp. Ac-20340]
MAPVVRTGGPSGLDSGRYSGATGCHPIFALILPATYVFCLLQIDASLKRPACVVNSSLHGVSTFAERYRRMVFFKMKWRTGAGYSRRSGMRKRFYRLDDVLF